MKRLFFILLLLSACSKEPETYCFECHSKNMQITYINCTKEEMNEIIEYWMQHEPENWNCTILSP